MSKSIKIVHDGKTYTLSYTKRTVQEMERNGFIAEKTDEMTATMIPMLFYGAFLRNHRFTKDNVKEEIWERITDKPGLIAALIDLYNEAMMFLVDEPEDEAKKVGWTMEE